MDRWTEFWSAVSRSRRRCAPAQELSRLLAATEASEAQLRELVEYLPELAWTARTDGFIDYCNRQCYEYAGTTFEEIQGWGWKALLDPAGSDTVMERWQHSIDTGEPVEECPLRGAGAVFRWFLTRARPLHDLRNPLSTILTTSRLLVMREDTPGSSTLSLGASSHEGSPQVSVWAFTFRIASSMRTAARCPFSHRSRRAPASKPPCHAGLDDER